MDARGRQIIRLAGPAFVALVAEPVFLLADSAIIGHLGTVPLAGLGVAGAALATAVGVFVFLAYGTTASVARSLGAGRRDRAIAAGIDGLWLAIALGVATALGVGAAAEPICATLGAQGPVLTEAAAYLRVAAAGLPAMLVVLAATGVLRGFQDTVTPLVVSVIGFAANIALNLLLVYGFGLGIVGSAWGTVIAQAGMGAVFAVMLIRLAVRERAGIRPQPLRVLRAGLSGVPLLVRTLALRAILLLTTWVAAALGDVPLASHQVALSIWNFMALALDALAIAAQALTGTSLGEGDVEGVRSTTATMIRWGVLGGAVAGGFIVLARGPIAALFTTDPAVREALAAALIVVGLSQALSGYVFVLDGVLIGAGDAHWLAGAMAAVLALYLPIILAFREWLAPGLVSDPTLATAVLWLVFLTFMVLRAIGLGWRNQSGGWLVTGDR